MTPRQVLMSILHLFVVFAFFAAAFFCMALSFLPDHRLQITDEDILLIGFGILTASFLLLLGFYALNRGRFLKIRMGDNWTEIDRTVIHQTLEELLKKHEIALNEVEIILSKRIEIGVTIKKEPDLEVVEKQLQLLLRERFGYTKPFFLIMKT